MRMKGLDHLQFRFDRGQVRFTDSDIKMRQLREKIVYATKLFVEQDPRRQN
jgi:hypothetical protein